VRFLVAFLPSVFVVGASSFTADLSLWKPENLLEMDMMFWDSLAFTSDLPWDISKVKNLSLVLANASSFSGDISSWNTTLVEDM